MQGHKIVISVSWARRTSIRTGNGSAHYCGGGWNPGGGGPPNPGGGGKGTPGGNPGGRKPGGAPGIPGGANGIGGLANAGGPEGGIIPIPRPAGIPRPGPGGSALFLSSS